MDSYIIIIQYTVIFIFTNFPDNQRINDTVKLNIFFFIADCILNQKKICYV